MSKLDKYYGQTGGNAAILENKEYVKTDAGQVLKIKNAPKHENKVLKINGKSKKVPFGKGGVVIPNVESAVSATHENRNSKNRLYTYKDEEIKIMPKEVKAISAALALPVKLQKKAISPSKFLDLLIEKKDNTLKKYKDPANPRISPERFSAIKSNQSVLASLPSTEDLYDFVFDLQESKKSGNFEDTFAQTGMKKTIDEKKRIYDAIRPSNYGDLDNYTRYFGLNTSKRPLDDARSEEGFKQYLGLNDSPKYLRKSTYKPTISNLKDYKNREYYSVDKQLENDIFNSYKDKVKLNEVLKADEFKVKSKFDANVPRTKDGYIKLADADENFILGRPMTSRARMLGNFTVSKGKDEKGEYLSYADQYDFPEIFQSKMKGNPYSIYGRIYYDNKQTGGKAKLSNYPYMKGSRPALPTSNGKSIEVLDGRTISMDQIYDADSVIVKGNEGKTFYKSKLKKYIR